MIGNENETVTVTMGQMVSHLYNAMDVLKEVVKNGKDERVMDQARIALARFNTDFGTENPLPIH
jgi:hypothetical protein